MAEGPDERRDRAATVPDRADRRDATSQASCRKLGLGESAHEHRRVLAVLAWLGVTRTHATLD